MSELQDLCGVLETIDSDILSMAQSLHGHSQGCGRASAAAASAARSAEGEAAAALARIAATLAASARACGMAARHLIASSREGQAYIRRTVGGVGGGAATPSSQIPKGNGLTPGDEQALADYTGEGYRELNPALRGKSSLTPSLVARRDALSTALSKLPSYSGLVVRGATLSESYLSRYSPGARVREAGFTSCDTQLAFAGNTIFQILSKSGRRVTPWSAHSDQEDEVLFDHGTVFEVVGHDIINGTHSIVLKEFT